MRHGLAVAKFALSLAGVGILAWLTGLGAYWVLLAVTGEHRPFGEVNVMAVWSGIGFAIALPSVYFPALTMLATSTRPSPGGILLRASACALLGIVPAVFLIGWLGGSGSVVLLFWAIFAVDGAALAVGHWFVTRMLEPS